MTKSEGVSVYTWEKRGMGIYNNISDILFETT